MSLSKIALIASLISFSLTTTALADDTQNTYQVSPEQLAQASQNGYFAGIDLGFVDSDWKNLLPNDTITEHANGGFGFAFNGGYRWNHRIAVETGFQYIPKVKYTSGGQDFTITNWQTYSALELDAPAFKNTIAFVQAGLGFHYFNDTQTSSDTIIRPYYAVGMSYLIRSHWKANIKLSSYSSDEQVTGHTGYIPAVNSFLLGAQYQF